MTTTIIATVLIIYLSISTYGTYQIGKELDAEKQNFKEDFILNIKSLLVIGFVFGIIYLLDKLILKNFISLLMLINFVSVLWHFYDMFFCFKLLDYGFLLLALSSLFMNIMSIKYLKSIKK